MLRLADSSTLPDPMIDVSLFRVRGFSTAIGTEMLVIFAVTAALPLVSQYLQLVQGVSPL